MKKNLLKVKTGTPSNVERAGWAQAALAGFLACVGQYDEPLETNLTDLLADLMHLCGQSKVDFDECLRIARQHYSAEVKS